MSASSGSFEIDGLAADTYTVCAITGDGRIGIRKGITARAGERVGEVQIEVELGARITLRCVDLEPIGECRVISDGFVVHWTSIGAGRAKDFCVPAGMIEVRWRSFAHPDLEHTRQVNVKLREPCELMLRPE
jgi:hypothetical protein